jgi:hypothetical protein
VLVKTALLFFEHWKKRLGKINVLFRALAFLVQMFNFSSISALLTTPRYTQ